MSARKLTVMAGGFGNSGLEIRMRGQWLAAAGFAEGQRCAVEITGPGQLTLTVKPTDSASLWEQFTVDCPTEGGGL